MKRIKHLFLFLLMMMFLLSCEDILEKDISNSIVTIYSPDEGEQILGSTVNFNWETIEGVENYRLQILQGVNNSRIILDSLVVSPFFNINLDPGEYSWRLRGENFAYKTEFSNYYDFKVIFSDDLTNQEILLESPSHNLYTNNADLLFSWKELPAVESYSFKLQRKNGSEIETVDQKPGIMENFYQPAMIDSIKDSEYVWSVRGENSSSMTEYSSRNLYLDKVKPRSARLMKPENNKVLILKTVAFEWELPNDIGIVLSPRVSFLEISLDVGFEQILDRIEVTNNTKTVVFVDNGTFYWRVQVKDKAGNYSTYSDTRSLILE